MKNLGSWLNWTFGVGLLSAFIFLSVFIFMRQKEKEIIQSETKQTEQEILAEKQLKELEELPREIHQLIKFTSIKLKQ